VTCQWRHKGGCNSRVVVVFNLRAGWSKPQSSRSTPRKEPQYAI